jgi:glucose/arabinose dehydrogenase
MMRRFALALVLGTACGHHAAPAVIDDGAIDAPTVDAAPPDADPEDLFGCMPNAGTTMSARKIGSVGGLGGILATSPPGDRRLFVVERAGRIYIFDHEQMIATPFLDLRPVAGGPVKSGGDEFGLLGLAFDPAYKTNGYFYVYYTDVNVPDPANNYFEVIARYSVSAADPNRADPKSGKILLSILDYATAHNGGMLEFGPDGYLYLGDGDGGGDVDPHRTGQNKDVLLGKISRIDVAHPANGKPYGIPPDNPFAAGGGAPEVYILGVRNPWRFSFDRGTGDLWIADVGQGTDEELDVLPAGQQAGKNLGWSLYEAKRCTHNYPCDPTGMTMPLDVRNHAVDGWRAIIGGQVYRGPCYPGIVGKYFYADFVAPGLARATQNGDGSLTIENLTGTFPARPTSLHADSRGELYITTITGDVHHLEASP